jgi:hypothetical protein
MSNTGTLDPRLTRRTIERELDLVAGAIRMVAGGGAPGVTLAGLAFGPTVLEGSERAAHNAGVTLEALWQPDDARCDIRVHRPHRWSDAG